MKGSSPFRREARAASFCRSAVGRCTVGHGALDLRENHAVQGIGVAGAPQILHRRVGLLHGPAQLPHKGVLPHAGTALQHHKVICILQVHHLREEVLEPLAAVGAYKEVSRLSHTARLPIESHSQGMRPPGFLTAIPAIFLPDQPGGPKNKRPRGRLPAGPDCRKRLPPFSTKGHGPTARTHCVRTLAGREVFSAAYTPRPKANSIFFAPPGANSARLFDKLIPQAFACGVVFML